MKLVKLFAVVTLLVVSSNTYATECSTQDVKAPNEVSLSNWIKGLFGFSGTGTGKKPQ